MVCFFIFILKSPTYYIISKKLQKLSSLVLITSSQKKKQGQKVAWKHCFIAYCTKQQSVFPWFEYSIIPWSWTYTTFSSASNNKQSMRILLAQILLKDFSCIKQWTSVYAIMKYWDSHLYCQFMNFIHVSIRLLSYIHAYTFDVLRSKVILNILQL